MVREYIRQPPVVKGSLPLPDDTIIAQSAENVKHFFKKIEGLFGTPPNAPPCQ
jgi:hypothetical protein